MFLKTINSSKRTVFILVLLIVGTVSILLFFNNKAIGKSPVMFQGKNKLAVSGEISTVTNSGSVMYCNNDLLLEAQGDSLRVKNIEGEIVWSQKYAGSIIKMAAAGSNIVIIDSSSNISYYSEQGKLLWDYKPSFEVIDVFTEENGTILVEYKGISGGRAEVFTQTGSKIGNISVNNAQILSFSSGKSSYSISIIDMAEELVKTKIITYNFKGDILWANNFDNKLITKLNYTKNDRLMAVSENEILCFKNDGELLEELKIDGNIISVAMSDYMTVVVSNKKGKNYLICYDLENKMQSNIEIDKPPQGVFPLKNNFIVYYKDELMIFTTKGIVTALHKSNTDISRAYMTLDNKIYIVSNRKLQLLEYSR
jgi:hypothetical protein